MTTSGQAERSQQFRPEEAETIRRELDLVLISPQFTGSKRCHDFLVFIVNRALEGNAASLTERFIGADLFGRPVDYDTKVDSIVRVCANDVRRRLADYRSHQSAARPVAINLSSGTYVPEFQWSFPENPEPAGGIPTAGSMPNGDAPGAKALNEVLQERRQALVLARAVQQSPLGVRILSLTVGMMIVLLSIACGTLWYQLRDAGQALHPWNNSPAIAGFWGTFLDDKRDTDLVLSDSAYSLLQALTNKPISLDEYMSRNYSTQMQGQSPEIVAALTRISQWGLGSPSEFDVVQRLLALDPARRKIHLYTSRKYMPDLIMKDNVILIGSRFGNPWAQLFESHMNFAFEPDNPNEIVNRNPAPGESRVYGYTPAGSVGYCVVAYLPNPDHNGNALLIQGTSGEPTQAAGEFLLSEDELQGFLKALHVSKLPYFELLLKTSWIKGTPINSSIVAYRTYTSSR